MTSPPPLPAVGNPLNAPFWQATREGRLVVQACGRCGVLRHPPRPVCASCGSFETTWQPVSGRASVWSFIVLHPPVLPAFAEDLPMPVIVAELDLPEPIRIVGGLDPTSARGDWAGRLVVGAPVQATFRTVDDDVALVDWKLIDEIDEPSEQER